MKIMPSEPTNEMLNAATQHITNTEIYKAMYAAAPAVDGEHPMVFAMKISELQKRIVVLEDLLSSAYAIANRSGESTHWFRFAAMLHINGISPVTAKTFKILPSDPEYKAAVDGEPVAQVHQNAAGQISLISPNDDYFDISKHVGLQLYTFPPDAAAKIAQLEKEKSYLEANLSHLTKQVDYIIEKLGLTQEQAWTEGGSLHAPRICNHIQETLDALGEANNRAAHLIAKTAQLEKDKAELVEALGNIALKWMPEKVYRGGLENGYWTPNGAAVLEDREKIVALLTKMKGK